MGIRRLELLIARHRLLDKLFAVRESFGFSWKTAQLIIVLTLLSFVMIRNVAYPLSDICFFGASVPALLVLLRTEEKAVRDRFWRLSLLVPLIAFCIELRTIGICLIPAFIWAAMGGATGARWVFSAIKRHRILAVLSLVAVSAVLGMALLQSRYLKFNLPIFLHRGIVGTTLSNLRDHTQEWGEMTINAPVSKTPRLPRVPDPNHRCSCDSSGLHRILGKAASSRWRHAVCGCRRGNRFRLSLV